MAQRQLTVNVERYHPEQGAVAYVDSYQVPARDGMMVLDALNYIRDDLDPTLAFRWSCRMGICGSCGMTVDDRPRLTCQDNLASYGDEITVAPLDGFPVIRDLVVDIDDFMQNKLPSVKPWLIRKDTKPLADGEYLQTPRQMAPYANNSSCINCMLCYAACPVYNLEPHFAGPAAIALAQRYNLDSRDQGAAERYSILAGPEGVWDCTFIGECSVACPKGVFPAEAIQRAKPQSAQSWAKSILMPWSSR